MRTFTLSLVALGAVLVPSLVSTQASAQATRTWVSGVGDDVNPCSRTAPCKTFAGAISKTAAGGVINCLDPGGFGAVTINKSLTIDCAGTMGGVLVSGGINGITVFNSASPTTPIDVILRNISLDGVGSGAIGIRYLQQGSLRLDNVNVWGFNAGSAIGVQFAPNGTSHMVISNSTITNNGTAATGAGVQIRPTGGVASAVLDNVVVARGRIGVAVDGFGGGTGANVTVRDSTIAGNSGDGVLVTSTVVSSAMVHASAISNNGGIGLNTQNGGATIRVGSSAVTGNGTATGGNVLSYGNNQINGNGVDTVPTLVPGGLH